MEAVVLVKASDSLELTLKFNTSQEHLFDMKPYLDRGDFKRLKELHLFNQANVAFDTVYWPGNLDIAPATLYDKSRDLISATK